MPPSRELLRFRIIPLASKDHGAPTAMDRELTETLQRVLLETAEAFLRTAQSHHEGGLPMGEYEITLAVRRCAPEPTELN
jgi:hypothetical protein